MTNRERERMTLNFQKPDRGSAEETFFPWTLTAEQHRLEGIPEEICDKALSGTESYGDNVLEKYLPVSWGEDIAAYEAYMGFDPVRRIHFALPFRAGDSFHAGTLEDWETIRAFADRQLERYFSDELIERIYRPLKAGHDRGDYSIRLHLEGFFWVPRELMGIEAHLYGFYDEPGLIRAICDYMLGIYSTKLLKVIDLLQPDIVYFMEDLSGKNGPMISGDMLEAFVLPYYRKLIPMLKEHGVGNVFVDTDGDFALLIPHFMSAGVDGFLPMDVNAGMDIVKVREQFPTLKFIGGYNKLCIAEGRDAIDREFQRILPVIRQGGYIPGADHQVPPSASLENYRYYIGQLKEMMKQCGADL